MAEDNLETNIAITLRDIAVNCDKKSGVAIRACEKAAKDGLDHVLLKVSVEDREYLYVREQTLLTHPADWVADYKKKLSKLSVPPLIQKLESLGFKLESSNEQTFWAQIRCYIIARW